MAKIIGTICTVIGASWSLIGLWLLSRGAQVKRDDSRVTIESTIGDMPVIISADTEEQAVDRLAYMAAKIHVDWEAQRELERLIAVPPEQMN